MSNESITEEAPASTSAEPTSVEAKLTDGVIKKVDGIVEKILGAVGDHPWEQWLATANAFIGKYMPFAIALSGVLAFLVGLIFAIRYNMPISWVLAWLCVLVFTAFSMHLSPKALVLARSLVEKGEPDAMRPELMYILKVLFGLGGLVVAVMALLLQQFSKDAWTQAAVLAVISPLTIIVFSNPRIVGLKEGYPQNGVEELITILMFPLKALLALLTTVLGIAVVAGFVYGIVKLFTSAEFASVILLATAVIPLLLPLAVYLAYLFLMFGLEFYRALVSIPRRLEDVRKAISNK